MKKVISLALAVLLVFGLCACSKTDNSGNSTTNSSNNSKKESPATIVDNEGNTVEMTAAELVEVAGNGAKFDKYYRGASITFTGKVKRVETSLAYNSSSFYDMIFFEEGWIVYLPEDTYDNGKYADILAEIDVGDMVTVSSDICFCSSGSKEIDIRGMADDNIGFDEESMLTTVITINN